MIPMDLVTGLPCATMATDDATAEAEEEGIVLEAWRLIVREEQ